MHSAPDNTLVQQILSLCPPSVEPAHAASTAEAEQFSYINNPDGTIRWFFPSSQNKALFLSLYQKASWKSKAYHVGAKAAFAVGQQHRLFSGTFTFPESQNLLAQLVHKMGYQQYAVFTGTAGADRKSVVSMGNGGHVKRFLKIAHTETALQLVQNEQKALEALSEMDIPKLFTPQVYPTAFPHILAMDNVKPQSAQQATELNYLHTQILQSFYNQGETRLLHELDAWKKAGNQIQALQDAHKRSEALNTLLPRGFVEKLLSLYNSFDDSQEAVMSMAHGDFTPWNMYMSQEGLHVFDWERASDMPAFFDAFHFIYQSQILLKRKGSKGIKRQVESIAPLFPHTHLRRSVPFYHRLYFILQVSETLTRYASQNSLLSQSAWMIRTWDKILTSFHAQPHTHAL